MKWKSVVVHYNVQLRINAFSTLPASSFLKKLNNIKKEFLYVLEGKYMCDDSGMEKIRNLIEDTCNKLGIYNDCDRKDFIKCIFVVLNRDLGITNTTPITITKSAIEQLNSKCIYDEISKYLSGEKLDAVMHEYYFGTDGYIDDFCQGRTGDCWLLAAISALCASDDGKQIISDSIQKVINENGEEVIRLTFKGIGVSYDISYAEMVEARESSCYAYGDTDILALELATEKLRRELATYNKYLEYGTCFTEDDDGIGGSGIVGGHQQYLLYYLTGNINIKETMEITPENTEKLGIVIDEDGKAQYDARKVLAFLIELINKALKKNS